MRDARHGIEGQALRTGLSPDRPVSEPGRHHKQKPGANRNDWYQHSDQYRGPLPIEPGYMGIGNVRQRDGSRLPACGFRGHHVFFEPPTLFIVHRESRVLD
jgi:hypothetical protein